MQISNRIVGLFCLTCGMIIGTFGGVYLGEQRAQKGLEREKQEEIARSSGTFEEKPGLNEIFAQTYTDVTRAINGTGSNEPVDLTPQMAVLYDIINAFEDNGYEIAVDSTLADTPEQFTVNHKDTTVRVASFDDYVVLGNALAAIVPQQ